MAVSPLQPGTVFDGKFEIVRILGRGDTALVYEAIHQRLDQRVAVVTPPPEMLGAPAVVEVFESVARAVAKLRTPYAPKMLDVDVTSDGIPYLVMERLEGADLGSILERRKRLPISEAVDYVLQAAVGMHEAHQRGVTHGDLKPANLFLAKESDGDARIKVFPDGISKNIPSELPVDGRGDVWSLGAVLYALLSGEPPIRAPDRRPPSVDATRPEVPRALAAVIDRALAPNPDARQPDMLAFIEALVPFGPPDARVFRFIRHELANEPNAAAALARVSAPSALASSLPEGPELDFPRPTLARRAAPWAIGCVVLVGIAISMIAVGGGTDTSPSAAPAPSPSSAPVVPPEMLPASISPVAVPVVPPSSSASTSDAGPPREANLRTKNVVPIKGAPKARTGAASSAAVRAVTR